MNPLWFWELPIVPRDRLMMFKRAIVREYLCDMLNREMADVRESLARRG